MSTIPNAPVKRILKEVNGQKPVADGAVEAMAEYLEEAVREVGGAASALARHRGKVTVEEKDVRLAVKTKG